MEWKEAERPRGEDGPIYNFRRGYKVRDAGRHESASQFAAFQEYLRMPGLRNFHDLSKLTGHKAHTLSGWATRWKWERRAAAWHKDQMAITFRDVDKLKREAHKEAIAEFRNSSERQARIMSRVSEDLVRLLGKRIAKAEENNEEIPMHMVGGLLRAAASINDQSRQAWGHALGVNELLEVVENEVEKVRIEEMEAVEVDPYEIDIED
jgi:hypothetical protein